MRSLLILFFFACAIPSIAQEDTVWLPPLEVEAFRMEQFARSARLMQLDSTSLRMVQGATLAQALARLSHLNVRSYGVGGLSTISTRGTGSNHTQVVWEGINLQSPMSGVLDINQMPLSAFNEVAIQTGANSAMYGSGAMGGTIQLSSGGTMERISVSQQLGSFAQWYQDASFAQKIGDATVRVTGSWREAENDFRFYNRFRSRLENRSNARTENVGSTVSVEYNPTKRQTIYAKYWWQRNDADIPGNMSVRNSQSRQYDSFHRAVLRYSGKLGNGAVFSYKTGVVTHDLSFNDGVGLNADHFERSLIFEPRLTVDLWDNLRIEQGMNMTLESSESITKTPSSEIRYNTERNRSAIYTSLLWHTEHTDFNLSAREELNDQEWSPFLPSIGLVYHGIYNFKMKSKVSRSYRIPNLNDLYWQGQGANGNPNLKPERGWSYEAGLAYEYVKLARMIQSELTVYYITIHDWIVWKQKTRSDDVPGEIGNWAPQNLQQLWSAGIEYSLDGTRQFSGNSTIRGRLVYQYNKAWIDNPFKSSDQKRVAPYSPTHQGSLMMNYAFKNWSSSAIQTFVGSQYIDESNIAFQALPAYYLLDLVQSYKVSWSGGSEMSFALMLNNVLNQSYEVRNAYPMPGSNWMVSIKYSFK